MLFKAVCCSVKRGLEISRSRTGIALLGASEPIDQITSVRKRYAFSDLGLPVPQWPGNSTLGHLSMKASSNASTLIEVSFGQLA